LALHVVLESKTKGSVAVYGPYLQGKRAQEVALFVLLGASVLSIILAVIGELK
jgi:hypothetical protein